MRTMQFVQKFIYVALAVAVIATLPGCRRKPGTHAYLRPLASYIDYQKTNQGITLRAKKLSAQDCESLLGRRAHRLWKKRNRRKRTIIPIQLSISNQTGSLIALQPKDIDLELTPYNNVARRLHRSSSSQAFGKLFGGIMIAGALVAGGAWAVSAGGILLVVIGSSKAALIGGSILLATPIFFVITSPAASTITNAESKRNLKENSLKYTLLVEPGETVDTLIFVSKQQYTQEFDITMRSPHNLQNRIPFHVKLLDQI